MTDLWNLLQLAAPPTMLALVGFAAKHPAHHRRLWLGVVATLLVSCAAFLAEALGVAAPPAIALPSSTAMILCGATTLAALIFTINVFVDRADA